MPTEPNEPAVPVLRTRTRRKVTLQEIADAAGVSKSTVSLVLNERPNALPISERTRRRVADAAERLGYRPNAAAKALATGRSYTVLLATLDFWDEHLVQRLAGIESYLAPHGYTMRLSTVDSHTGLGPTTEILRSGQADGILLSGVMTAETFEPARALRDEAEANGIPLIALSNTFPSDLMDVACEIEDENGAYLAVQHLIEHGHRKIAFLGVEQQGWSVLREQGYRRALADAGIAVDPQLIVASERKQSSAYENVVRMSHELDFTAMFVVTDHQAVAAMTALKASGRRVPEDCALTAFDDNPTIAPYADPPLTTIHNPFVEVGRRSAEKLLRMIEGLPYNVETLPVSLVIRRSCGCP